MSDSSSFAPPGESASDLWLERSVFAGTILGSVAFGVHLSVFAIAVYYMVINPPSPPGQPGNIRRRIPWGPLSFIFVFFALGVFQVAGNTKYFEHMWIDDRNVPGGPIGWYTEHFDDPVNTFASVAYILANFLMDGMLLYRLLVIYNYNFLVVIIPGLAFIASSILSAFTVFQSAQPGQGLFASTTFQFAVPYFSLSIALNATMTLAIVIRLIYMRQRLSAALSATHAKMYTSVAAFFIESNAAYTIVGLIFIISYARNSNVQNLCLQTLDQVVCISPELIILRIYLGRAWSRSTTAQISQHPLISMGGERTNKFDKANPLATTDGITMGNLTKKASKSSTKSSGSGKREVDEQLQGLEELRSTEVRNEVV